MLWRIATLLVALALILLSLIPSTAAETNIFLRGAELPRPVLNIAHGGASSLAPQNTIAAGRKAFEVGADLWGIDVRLTKDGVFILMHDESLKRTTDVEEVFPGRSPWLVKDFTLEEIEELDAGSWFVESDPFGQIAVGNVSPEDQQSYIGEKVPTLREALEFTRENNWRIDVEVKSMDYFPREEIARKLLALIRETRMESRVMVSSFDHDLLRKIKELDPAIPTATLVIFAPRDPAGYLEDLGADAYDPSPLAFNPRIAAELRALGYGVYIWTYNEATQLRNFAAMEGVSGIFTDFPQRLEPILDGLFGPDED
jgi:glycerophosphoryl diester phosphodiesterase